MSVTGTVPTKVPKKLSELELDAGGKRIDNLGIGDTPDDAMRRSEKTGDYEVYGLLAVGLAVNRPAPGIVDRFYFSTDTLVLERDTGVAWVEVVRGETAIRLAQLAEKVHSSLTGIGASDHHDKTTSLGDITDHNLAAHGLGIVVPHDTLASLTEKAHGSLTGVTASQHHAKTTLFTALTDRWTLAQAHRGADGKIMVFKGPVADPVEEDKPAAGGLYGINVESLTGSKTLTPGTDKIYQYLDPGASPRDIILDTASAVAGDRFIIRHNGAYDNAYRLAVRQAAIPLDDIYAGAIKEFIFDGTNWISRGIGTGEDDTKKYLVVMGAYALGYDYGIAIGYGAQGYRFGVAIGYGAYGYTYGLGIAQSARGYTYGVAIGRSSKGYNRGLAVGMEAEGYDYGIAIGGAAKGYSYGVAIGRNAKTNAKKYSIALGYQSECERIGETSININGNDSDQENNVVQGRWEWTSTHATPMELFCAGQWPQRFTIRPSSVLAFEMVIVARDNVANEIARYSVHDGLIKRDGAGNTIMVNCTVVTDYEDDASWGVAVTADDTNEALIITVTGDATNPVQWAAVMNGVETHF